MGEEACCAINGGERMGFVQWRGESRGGLLWVLDVG